MKALVWYGDKELRFEEAPARKPAADEVVLPFQEETDGTSFRAVIQDYEETPLDQGVAQTVARFRELLAKGLVTAP